MSAVPKQKISLEQYLAQEKKAEFKSEYYEGELFAMAGANGPHNNLRDNLIGELHAKLKGGPCRTVSSDQRVKVNRTGFYTYPDIAIVCGGFEYDDGDNMTLLNPRIIIEILSESTETYDRGTKFRHYQQIPSLQEYVLVSQNEVVIERFVRQADGSWNWRAFTDRQGSFHLTSVPVELLLAEVYRDVVFDPTQSIR
jgi:Uma2 family endonuclease